VGGGGWYRMSMRAVAVYPAERRVCVIDHPEPKIESATQAKIRLLEVGICGTDKEIVSFEYGVPPEGCDYLVIGHESVGQVVEVGADVSNVKVGDLVVPTVRRPCAHPDCVACLRGRQDFCYTGDFTERGIKQRHGYMADFVVEEERYLNPVPAAVRDVAVLVEPLTIAEKALAQLWDIQTRLPWTKPGDGSGLSAMVLGAGPVGLLGAMAFRVAGFSVTVYSRSAYHEEKDDIVSAIGANYIAAETHDLDQMAKAVGRLDVVYEAVGASSFAFEVIRHLSPNGVFIFTGVPGRKGPIPVDTDFMMRGMVLNNQLIYGTVNAPTECFAAAIRDMGVFVERWPDAVKRIVTGRYPLENALEPLSGKGGGIKNIVEVGHE
jgi:threonine dehydrogenase-like Zn-dependent dehydrogenase